MEMPSGVSAVGHGAIVADGRVRAVRLSVAADRVASVPVTETRRPPAPAAARRPLAGLPRLLRAPVENFSTTTGQHTNAVYGFTSMLINVLRDEQPTHVAVAFDVSRQTFRLEEYAEYKAKRNKTPDEFSSQLPLIKEVLDALRIPLPREGGLRGRRHHRHARHPGRRRAACEVLILTGDRDSLQLVTDDVDRALPDARGLRPGPDDARRRSRTKYGVPPRPLPRARGASSARPPTTCPASRASARATPPSGSTSTTASTTSSPTPTRSPARRARRCASTSAT